MRKRMRVFTLVMAVAMLLSLAVSVSAADDVMPAVNFGIPAGIYGYIHGLENFNSSNNLHTSTTVTQNPDGAKLYTGVEFQDAQGRALSTSNRTSAAGVTKYESNHACGLIAQELVYAFVRHEVRGNASYAYYSLTDYLY